MKGLLLAGGCLVLIMAVSAVGLKLYRGNKEFKVLLSAFIVGCGAYGLLFLMVPANVGVLPPGWVEPPDSRHGRGVGHPARVRADRWAGRGHDAARGTGGRGRGAGPRPAPRGGQDGGHPTQT